MSSTGRVPFIRILLPFICGVLLWKYSPRTQADLQAFLLLPGLFLLAGHFIPNKKRLLSSVFGFAMHIFFILLGFITCASQDMLSKQDNFSRHAEIKKQPVLLEILRLLKSGNGKSRYEADVLLANVNGRWESVSGRVLIHLQSASGMHLLPGSRFVSPVTFYRIRKNTGSGFDYASYMQTKGIQYQLWVRDTMLHSIPTGASLTSFFAEIRQAFIMRMKLGGIEGNELSVASALIFGADEEIGKDVFSDYAATGAIHILSVSGLHVGLVFLVFAWLFDRLFGKARKQLLKSLLLILALWLYGGITGFSPSVLRSVTMFSILALGQGIHRSGNPLNSIAVSCFILLLADPFLLFDAGFQLSYLAVTGIIVFYKDIRSAWEPDSKAISWLWNVTAVSIAAQLATLPVSLYYFHQFPLLFILTNIFVIPLAAFILYAGIALIIVGWIPLVNALICECINWLTWFLNRSLEFLAGLPGHLITGIEIGLLSVFLLYALIFIIQSWLRTKHVNYLKTALALVAVMIISESLLE